MKTYDEMTSSVLQRATACIAERNRRRKTILAIAASGLCLALVLVAVGAFWKAPAGTDNTNPTISMKNPTTAPAQPESTEPNQQDVIVSTGKVHFLSATAEEAKLTPMQANITLPMDHLFRVRSLIGLTDEQIYEARLEEQELRLAFLSKYSQILGEGSCSDFESDEVIIQQFSGGVASLILLDYSQIESVERETTGVLDAGESYAIYHTDYTIGKGECAVTIPAGSRRIFLPCRMSSKTIKIFSENPDTPLSTIKDTITITINYKNGTKEIVIIDVTVDDDGQIYMTQRGNNTGV